LVEWAICFDDGKTKIQQDSSQASARLEVLAPVNVYPPGNGVNNAVNLTDDVFGLAAQEEPLPYASRIEESSEALLEPDIERESNSTPTQGFALPIEPRAQAYFPESYGYQYSTLRYDEMFYFGEWTDSGSVGMNGYLCAFPAPCDHITYAVPALKLHYVSEHFPFTEMPNPLRMVCPSCETFYSHSVVSCPQCPWATPVLRVYGLCGPQIHVEPPSEKVSSGIPPSTHQAWGVQQNFSDMKQDSGGYDHNSATWNRSSHGSSGSNSIYRSLVTFLDAILFWVSYFRFPQCQYRLFATAILGITSVFGLISLERYDWISAKLSPLLHNLFSIFGPNFPILCILVASIAFILLRLLSSRTRCKHGRIRVSSLLLFDIC
jgi:hypothetical protein